MIFPPQRQDRLEHRVPADLAAAGSRPPRCTAGLGGSFDRQSASLPGRPPMSWRTYGAPSRAFRAATRAWLEAMALLMMTFIGRVGLEPVTDVLGLWRWTKPLTSVLPSLVWSGLELGVGDLGGDDGRQPLRIIVAREVGVLLLESFFSRAYLLTRDVKRRGSPPRGAALVGVDRVGEGVDRLRVPGSTAWRPRPRTGALALEVEDRRWIAVLDLLIAVT